MFTGIIEVLGCVRGFKPVKGLTYTLEVEAPKISKGFKMGGSLSVNGACLSLVKKKGTRLFFNVINETKKRTMFNDLKTGDKVNLERPLKFSGRVEGHFVLGHVDGVGIVRRVLEKGKEKSFLIAFPAGLKPYLVEKGSVAVDGVSMTLGKVTGNTFWVHCIPHTLTSTLFGTYKTKTKVNLEADLLAKLALTRRGRRYKL